MQSGPAMLNNNVTMQWTLLLLASAASVPAAAADVYRWVDEGGVVHFSQWAPKGEIDDVSTVSVDTSTPTDYDPQDDPYSILNQSERIHELWSDLLAQKDTRRAPEQNAESASSYPDDHYYRPGFHFLSAHPGMFRDRRPSFAQRQQQRVLDEFDRRAIPRSHSINSSVHRARIDAKRAAIQTVREQARGPGRPHRGH